MSTTTDTRELVDDSEVHRKLNLGNKVYIIDMIGDICYLYFNPNNELHLLAYHHGLLFFSEEEAKQNKGKVKEFWNKLRKEYKNK